jgi:endonuclease/exonuclease/phosphatase (EEP) superfamily protein YafD
VAELQLDGSRLTIVGVHPPPPKSARMTAQRNQHMEALAAFTSQQEGAVLVCGDLNLTPWSPTFLRTLKKGKLHDSTRGFGLQPTWPVENFLSRVPIDHCLHSEGLRIVNRSVGPAFGSDHFPLIIDFSVK